MTQPRLNPLMDAGWQCHEAGDLGCARSGLLPGRTHRLALRGELDGMIAVTLNTLQDSSR